MPSRRGGPTRGTAQKMASEVRPGWGRGSPGLQSGDRAPMASRGGRGALRVRSAACLLSSSAPGTWHPRHVLSVCLSASPSLLSAFGVSPGHSHPRTQLGVAPGGKGSDHYLGYALSVALPCQHLSLYDSVHNRIDCMDELVGRRVRRSEPCGPWCPVLVSSPCTSGLSS